MFIVNRTSQAHPSVRHQQLLQLLVRLMFVWSRLTPWWPEKWGEKIFSEYFQWRWSWQFSFAFSLESQCSHLNFVWSWSIILMVDKWGQRIWRVSYIASISAWSRILIVSNLTFLRSLDSMGSEGIVPPL